MTVDEFVAIWNGKLINNGGTQCVAVANQFNAQVVRGGWIGTRLTGYANDWWHDFGNDVDFNNYIRVGADQPMQKGDLPIWQKYAGNGLPHIALGLEDRGENVYCITQNPGPANKALLTKKGLLGYLRPKKFIKAAPAPSAPTAPAPGRKSNEEIAREVARGDWGNNPDRQNRLAANGYDYNAIQAIVNNIVGGAPAPAPAAPSGGHADHGGTFTVGHEVPGYVTADDAMAGRNSNSTVPVGTYAVFNRWHGAVNVTRQAGVPGWWLNPNV